MVGIDPANKKRAVVQAEGTGGLSEIHGALKDDEVQYGGFRVFAVDRRGAVETRRPKFVSFVWTGPDVGVIKKAQAASSKNEILKCFKGANVGLHLFERHDLSTEEVTAKLLAAGGAHKPERFEYGDGSDDAGAAEAAAKAAVAEESASAARLVEAAAAGAKAKEAAVATAAAAADSAAPAPKPEKPAAAESPADTPAIETAAVEVAVEEPAPAASGAGAEASGSSGGGDSDAAAPAETTATVTAAAAAAGAGADEAAAGEDTVNVDEAAAKARRASSAADKDAAGDEAKDKRKKRGVVFAQDEDELGGADGAAMDRDASGESLAVTTEESASKSDAAVAAIKKAMQHYMFAGLNADQTSAVIDEFKLSELVAGAQIITQGEKGDQVYIVESGSVQVLVDGRPVLTKDESGFLFGELALLYDAPRAASVVALTPVRIWVLKASRFRKVMIASNKKQTKARVDWLSKVGILSDLDVPKLTKLADLMEEKSFDPNGLIIRQGDQGDAFYVIKEGSVVCRVNDGGAGTDVATLNAGQFFGEMALLKDTPRTCNVLATEDAPCTCLMLDRKHFEDMLGPLQEVLDNLAAKRQAELDDVKVAAGTTDEAVGASGAGGDGDAAVSGDAPEGIDSESGGVAIPFALSDCETLGLLGEGSFGVVKMVRFKDEVLALKRLWKAEIVMARQTMHVMRERRILSALDFDGVVGLRGTAQDENSLFMLLELIQGGELWSLLYNEKSTLTGGSGGMKTDDARFYTWGIANTLAFLARQNVAYRDLKPENILIGGDGYLKFIDFGFAKSIPYTKDGEVHAKSYTMLGSPDYLPPEVILHKGHDKSVDLWALGCILYELLVGATPFADDNQNKTFERACQADLTFPDSFDEDHADARDLITRLITVDPVQRLGAQRRGLDDVLEHPFLAKLDAEQMIAHKIAAPHVPEVASAEDRSNFELGEEEYDSEDEEVVPFDDDDALFEGF